MGNTTDPPWEIELRPDSAILTDKFVHGHDSPFVVENEVQGGFLDGGLLGVEHLREWFQLIQKLPARRGRLRALSRIGTPTRTMFSIARPNPVKPSDPRPQRDRHFLCVRYCQIRLSFHTKTSQTVVTSD